MSENELRPCPFCGCTDNFITVTSNPFSNDIYSTTHCKCYATGPFIAENYLTGEKVPTRESMEDKATERWNTRPIEDELRAEIDRLIEAGNALSNGIAEAEIPFYVLSEEILRLRTDWKLIVDSLKGG